MKNQKNTIGVLLLCCLFLPLNPSAFSEETKTMMFQDGVYEASYKQTKVAVTIKDSQINDIKILSKGEDDVYQKKMQTLIQKIITTQSMAVDGVSGATVSSEALKKAVSLALEKSKSNN